jgi:hypothetical protein|nr:MAG TPA: hypothetical protein [Caudoviricetes sp.]DAW54325.1 MAG TPA: hypothetical protein [Caudoviricetes sp.]
MENIFKWNIFQDDFCSYLFEMGGVICDLEISSSKSIDDFSIFLRKRAKEFLIIESIKTQKSLGNLIKKYGLSVEIEDYEKYIWSYIWYSFESYFNFCLNLKNLHTKKIDFYKNTKYPHIVDVTAYGSIEIFKDATPEKIKRAKELSRESKELFVEFLKNDEMRDIKYGLGITIQKLVGEEYKHLIEI